MIVSPVAFIILRPPPPRGVLRACTVTFILRTKMPISPALFFPAAKPAQKTCSPPRIVPTAGIRSPFCLPIRVTLAHVLCQIPSFVPHHSKWQHFSGHEWTTIIPGTPNERSNHLLFLHLAALAPLLALLPTIRGGCRLRHEERASSAAETSPKRTRVSMNMASRSHRERKDRTCS